jgi:hypothetical protein
VLHFVPVYSITGSLHCTIITHRNLFHSVRPRRVEAHGTRCATRLTEPNSGSPSCPRLRTPAFSVCNDSNARLPQWDQLRAGRAVRKPTGPTAPQPAPAFHAFTLQEVTWGQIVRRRIWVRIRTVSTPAHDRRSLPAQTLPDGDRLSNNRLLRRALRSRPSKVHITHLPFRRAIPRLTDCSIALFQAYIAI